MRHRVAGHREKDGEVSTVSSGEGGVEEGEERGVQACQLPPGRGEGGDKKDKTKASSFKYLATSVYVWCMLH